MRRLQHSLALAVAPLLVLSAGASTGASSRGVSDGVLRVALRSGWSGSVGLGTQVVSGRPHTVSWILVGNFPFSSDAAAHEGRPSVPPGKLLISLGDFVLTGRSLRWPQVRHLRLPRRPAAQRVVSQHVRFARRAVSITVRFGSRPSAQSVALTNAVLASVRRVG